MRRLLLSLSAAIAVLSLLPLHSQTMPNAKLFAEGTIAIPGAFAITFSPDGRTLYCAKREAGATERVVLLTSRLRSGVWSPPEAVEFATEYKNVDPFLSPDGEQLFFASTRPMRDGKERSGPALWVMNKDGDNWSTPHPVLERDLAVSGAIAVFPSPVANGTLYFAGHLPNPAPLGRDDIYVAKRIRNGYAPPENLGPPINTVHHEYDAYVAPDESFVIFASDRPGGFGSSDLYMSVRRNGAWAEPVNLGSSVNSASGICCPSVSPDRKYFYFTTSLDGKDGIYQIDFPALTRALGLHLVDEGGVRSSK